MESKKKYRNGNGVLELARDATGKAADTLRATIEWNTSKEKEARLKRRHGDVKRHQENRARCSLELVRIAQSQR